MEGVNKKDRTAFLSTQEMRPRVIDTDDPDFNLVMYAPDQSARPRLSPKFEDRLNDAAQLGILVIKIPLYTELKLPISFVAKEPPDFVGKFESIYSAIKQRGVGRAPLENLGPELAMKAGGSHKFALGAIPDLSCYTADEREKIKSTVAEASDGDAVAAHFAFGNDLLCSEDFGKSASSPSVLDADNRNWLTKTFGIQFATLGELAQMIV
jgi:hypothetical protein